MCATRMVAENLITKVILETSDLTDQEIIDACKISKEAGAHFVKTSTGFYKGATVKHVKLMHKTVTELRDVESSFESVPILGVKASGGISTWKKAHSMMKAGASRIGTSSGAKILAEYIEKTITPRH